jgi:hypothetical protein
VSSSGNASEFAAELAILRDEGPPLDDPDPASLAEREVDQRLRARSASSVSLFAEQRTAYARR